MAKGSEKQTQARRKNGRKAAAVHTKHALNTHLTLSPKRWPVRSRRMYEARVLDVLKQSHIDEEVDIGLVAQLGRLEVLLAHVYEYLMKQAKRNKTLFDAEGNPEPVLRLLLTIENSLGRTYDRALLSPQSRKMFNMKVGQSVALLLSGGEEEE